MPNAVCASRAQSRWLQACGGTMAAGAGMLVAACGGAPVAAAHAALSPPARVTITTGNLVVGASPPGGVDTRPDMGVNVSVKGGTLSSVAVTTSSGRTVPGTLSSGRTAWRTTWALPPSQAFHVAVTGRNAQGRQTVTAGTFRTLTPRRTFTASTTMDSSQAYGVGMPIMVTFSHPITYKAEVERSFQVWSSKPVLGAWYWMNSTQVWFRPRSYWPAHTQVRFEAHLKGVQGAPGVYGDTDLAQRFHIGNSLIVVASAASHHMKVWWNGHFKGNWPVSTGQPGDDTPDGHYLAFTMGNPVDMDSASFGVMPGDPGYYNVEVYDSVKFTDSGDYVHSAPWSVGEQGYVNVSHGCVNVAPANAAWYYNRSLIGDPISVVGSPLKGTWNDGWTIWFLPWHKLVAGSATHQAVLATASGSQYEPAQTLTPNHARLRPVSGY